MNNFTNCQKAINRIECAISHIQKSKDIDLWARGIAIAAMRSQIGRIVDSGEKVEQQKSHSLGQRKENKNE